MITYVLMLTLMTSWGDKTLVSIGGLQSMEACHVMKNKFHVGLMVEDEKNRNAKIVQSECYLQKVT
jgi:hypothetical protein